MVRWGWEKGMQFAYRKARLSLPIRAPSTHRDNRRTHTYYFFRGKGHSQLLTSRAEACPGLSGSPPGALRLPASGSPRRPFVAAPPPHPKIFPHIWTVRAKGTYRTGLGANTACRDSSGKAPWRSQLLGPGVSGAPDMPSLALQLHARARTGPAASFTFGGVGVPVPGSRSGSVPREPRLGTVGFAVQET